MLKFGQFPVKDASFGVAFSRGIGIILVVWAHIFHGGVHDFIYKFHMPLFFMISGFSVRFFGNNQLSMKAVYRIFAPVFFAVFFLTLPIIFSTELYKYYHSGKLFNFLDDGYRYNFGRPGIGGVYSAYWFIFSLFFIKALSFVFSKMCERDVLLFFVSVFFGALISLFNKEMHSVPRTFIGALYCWQFYVFGVVLVNLDANKYKILAAFFIFFIFDNFLDYSGLDVSAKNFGIPLWSPLFACVVSVLIFRCGLFFKEKLMWVGVVVVYFGSNSLSILLYHQAIHLALINIFEEVNGWLVFLVALCLPLLLPMLAKKMGVGGIFFGIK
ncbi:fucose 4-O-acetylase-like acetyltransferase [Sphaerotilus hippei]|uniref:Fucose 4-O-acetylase-like acetyltransferase n=1 Tax=Sphaerotilus hippei TaxID=744406 RepID=A0A318H6K3_9BURK|nr:acyltransferase family protein [Sphaerotilus hippei]PXW93244.1 fucose 4-O-acetylase-like acetyltransferase [Sphaerotilus hippei]